MKTSSALKVATVAVALAAACTQAQTPRVAYDDPGPDGRRFGVGAMIGEPSGASLKYFITPESAIAGGIGHSFANPDGFHIHADYQYHLYDVFDLSRGIMPLYIGGGLRGKFIHDRDNVMGLRAVAGLNYFFDNKPIDVFLEGGPVIDVVPKARLRPTIAIGARFWF